MTTFLPAICKGDTLKLRKPLDLPDETSVYVAVITSSFKEGDPWDMGELLAFESVAYGPDEADYGTLDSLE